jgi:HNH endonuclease
MSNTACREWQGPRHADGYGLRRGKAAERWGTKYVHRQVWIMVNGPIPAGMNVLHTCDNPPCFRYDHLFLGTHADNVADKVAKGRGRNGWG